VFLVDALVQRRDLGVVTVVHRDGDTRAAGGGDESSGAVDGELAVAGGAPGDVHRRALLAKADSDAATDTAARTGDDGNPALKSSHGPSFAQVVRDRPRTARPPARRNRRMPPAPRARPSGASGGRPARAVGSGA
jgi:hypothetical protein